MNLLALEFSSSVRSVAVKQGEGAGAVITSILDRNYRATTPMMLVDRALQEARIAPADVDAVAVGLGPGSYTGVRSAIAVAQGWKIGRELRLIGVSSIEVMAWDAQRFGVRGLADFVVDAQRGDVCRAVYEIRENEIVEVEPLTIVPSRECGQSDRRCYGPDAGALVSGASDLFPSAAELARLATSRSEFSSSDQLAPIYLREAMFVKAAPRRQIN